jgi:predicted nuclease of predicted toxin-antitoxin system
MKFLLDMPVSFLLLQVLQAYGHEGVHAYQIGKDRASDRELLEIARLESPESFHKDVVKGSAFPIHADPHFRKDF